MCHLLRFYSAHSMGHNKNPKLSKRNLTKVIWCKKSAAFITPLLFCACQYAAEIILSIFPRKA